MPAVSDISRPIETSNSGCLSYITKRMKIPIIEKTLTEDEMVRIGVVTVEAPKDPEKARLQNLFKRSRNPLKVSPRSKATHRRFSELRRRLLSWYQERIFYLQNQLDVMLAEDAVPRRSLA